MCILSYDNVHMEFTHRRLATCRPHESDTNALMRTPPPCADWHLSFCTFRLDARQRPHLTEEEGLRLDRHTVTATTRRVSHETNGPLYIIWSRWPHRSHTPTVIAAGSSGYDALKNGKKKPASNKASSNSDNAGDFAAIALVS